MFLGPDGRDDENQGWEETSFEDSEEEPNCDCLCVCFDESGTKGSDTPSCESNSKGFVCTEPLGGNNPEYVKDDIRRIEYSGYDVELVSRQASTSFKSKDLCISCE